MSKVMSVEKFPLSQIVVDERLQTRVSVNAQTVDSYCESGNDSWPFPPIKLMLVDGRHLLIDGRHRYETAVKLELETIPAEIVEGTMQDAIRAACSSNAEHGLQRTNADKRRAVELAIAEFPNFSNREIAKICHVSHTSVNNVRTQEKDPEQVFDAWIEADGPYHPLEWRHEIGDACYQLEHENGEVYLLLIFQGARLGWGETENGEHKWQTEIYQSSVSGQYCVAVEVREEGRASFDILRPAEPESVKAILSRWVEWKKGIKATQFTNDYCFCSGLLTVLGVPGQEAYDRQVEKLRAARTQKT